MQLCDWCEGAVAVKIKYHDYRRKKVYCSRTHLEKGQRRDEMAEELRKREQQARNRGV